MRRKAHEALENGSLFVMHVMRRTISFNFTLDAILITQWVRTHWKVQIHFPEQYYDIQSNPRTPPGF